jgi:hypothetical protein
MLDTGCWILEIPVLLVMTAVSFEAYENERNVASSFIVVLRMASK